ncbi:MAG: electron transfer flavoprotein subunit beta/FixA family protein, partial [Deltaproteobacteria bacterium]|nr:electron transfer flavoprotein subunit beta/FixA family protein [Deltaproteobacteria bacterium]
ALQLKSKQGGEVILLTLGPDSAKQTIRKGLAMGADRALHINDLSFDNSDSFVVAKALAQAIKKLGAEGQVPDLILTGVQSEDGLNMQTGIMLAEFLGLPHASILTKFELLEGGKKAKGSRELEGGLLEDVELDLPAVVTIQTGINIPRYPTLPNIMKARAKEIKDLKLADLGLSSDQVGPKGSKVKVLKLFVPEKGKGAELIPGDEATATKTLMKKLKEEAKVL